MIEHVFWHQVRCDLCGAVYDEDAEGTAGEDHDYATNFAYLEPKESVHKKIRANGWYAKDGEEICPSCSEEFDDE